jgi:hypothetical protein
MAGMTPEEYRALYPNTHGMKSCNGRRAAASPQLTGRPANCVLAIRIYRPAK